MNLFGRYITQDEITGWIVVTGLGCPTICGLALLIHRLWQLWPE